MNKNLLCKHFFYRNKFDGINSVKQGNEYITYGIIHGDSTVIFIKVGFQASIYGYKHKYVKIAKKINKRHGCTVIVSSNPNGYSDYFEGEMNSVKAYAYYHHFNKYQIFYFGHSAGAILGMMHAYKYPEIKKVLLINPPLVFNEKNTLLDLIIFGITKFNNGKMNIILGTKDYSSMETEKIYECYKDKIQLHKVIGADHNFRNKLKIFSNIPELFFDA